MRETHILRFCLALFIVILFAGCDQTFQPLKENNSTRFSMFGFLDASADTQWVRVTPLREQLSQPKVKPEMHVTMEDIQDESSTVMNDSLFLFPDDFNVLNAWAKADIDPEHTYKLKAQTPDGGKSSVTFSTPEDFPVPELIVHENGECLSTLRIKGVKRLADVQYRWKVRVTRPTWEYVKYFTAGFGSISQIGPETYEVNFLLRRKRGFIEEQLDLLPPKNTKIKILEKHFFVASGGPEWINNEELASLDDQIYALPETASNVKNGTGYVFGIVSKTLPDTVCP